jgi:N-formylglutamate amidohydrolase
LALGEAGSSTVGSLRLVKHRLAARAGNSTPMRGEFEGLLMTNTAYGHIFRGDAPIVLAIPHAGADIPEELLRHPPWRDIQVRVADPAGLALRAAAPEHGVSCICARYHPCVIDFNVAASDRPLSRRLNRSGLCRTHTARGEPLYAAGCEPNEAEIDARVKAYWEPFHEAVARELARLRERHDNVLLLIPHASFWLSPFRDQFDASDCNVGTAHGKACDRRLVACVTQHVEADGRSWVVNGKIADAFAAEHYGRPDEGVHAMEIEVAGRWRAELERRRLAGEDGIGANLSARALFDALEAALRKLEPARASMGLATRVHGSAD